MTIWKFDENRARFRCVQREDVGSDPDGFYVFSRLDGLTIKAGMADPMPFPADGRLSVAGVEFSAKDFPCWQRFRELAGWIPGT